MKLLNHEDLEAKLGRSGFSVRGRHLDDEQGRGTTVSMSYSRLTAPQSISLAQSLARFPKEASYRGGIYWISDWGFRDSGTERLAKLWIDRIRGAAMPLEAAAGHLLDSDELVLTEALLSHSLFFRWGAYFVPESNDHYVEVSNDEIVVLTCRNQRTADLAMDYFSHWNPQLLA